jgi:predicted transcriptional regulator
MTSPANYSNSLSLREKIIYVLSVFKKESVGELSAEIMELDGIAAEESVAELTKSIEEEINNLCEEGIVKKIKEHRQKVRYVLDAEASQD